MKIDGYMPRLMDNVLESYLQDFGAVSLEGCKWCGKSTTARRVAKSVVELQDVKKAETDRFLAKTEIDTLLKGEKPRLIDEWQDEPQIWDAVRYDVDKSGQLGQYILTGSVTPKKRRPRHSGAGRFARLRMRPMSLFESGESNGAVSIGKLFEEAQELRMKNWVTSEEMSGKAEVLAEKTGGGSPEGATKRKGGVIGKAEEKSLGEIAYLCVRGGWPASVKNKPAVAGRLATSYLETLLQVEGRREDVDDDVIFSTPKMRMVIRSLARNIASPVTMKTIMRDTEAAGEPITDKTLATYLETLERLFLLDDVEPWFTRLRSKTSIRLAPKRNFADPSLVMAALRAGENDLIDDVRTFGLVFESLVLRDLKAYAQSLDGEVYYYRDKAGRECDAVIHLDNGQWGAIEIKLGADTASVEAGAASLKRFARVVDTDEMREPAFLMVVTGKGEYAYRREDGVIVVPVGCLRD